MATATATNTHAQNAAPVDENIVDTGAETGAASPEENDAEGRLALERDVAKKIGWTDRESWTQAGRDPSRWRDAPEYLVETPRQLKSLQERNQHLNERIKRNAQAAADAMEENRRQAREQALAEVRAAASSQDPEAIEAATQKLAKVTEGPHPETVAWISRNAWFNEDSEARAVAAAAVERSRRAGGTVSDQLQAAEAAAKKRFPEHFPDETPAREQQREAPRAESRTEVRLTDSRISAPPPAVSPGSRGGSGTPKAKGFDDIPAQDRALYDKHFAKKYGAYLKPEEGKARYAQSYWANKQDA